jgi:dTDP-4-amino-4,6-dideoxygalactose transaminase
MPPYEKYLQKGDALPLTEKLAQDIFTLPLYPTLTEEEQMTVCRELKALL